METLKKINGFELVSMTIAELLQLRNESKLNFSLQVQRPLVKAWSLPKRVDALKESILANWSIGILQVRITRDENGNITEIAFIDGKQRSNAILTTCNEIALLPAEVQAKILSYQLVMVDNTPLAMTDEEEACFFEKINSYGINLTSGQVMRGKYSAVLEANKANIKLLSEVTGFNESDSEKMFIYDHALRSEEYNLTKDVFAWFNLNQPKTVVSYQKRVDVLKAILNGLDESPKKRINKVVHLPEVLSLLTGNEDKKRVELITARLNSFFTANSSERTDRKDYNDACASATGSVTSVSTRMNILKALITSPAKNIHTGSDPYQESLDKMNAEREALKLAEEAKKKSTEEQPAADQPTLDINTEDPFLLERKEAYNRKHNKMKAKAR